MLAVIGKIWSGLVTVFQVIGLVLKLFPPKSTSEKETAAGEKRQDEKKEYQETGRPPR